MTFFITQCPHCSTTFRTRINQLQSADGMVRCGACLQVFVADDNLVPSAELQTTTLPADPVPGDTVFGDMGPTDPLPAEEHEPFPLFAHAPDAHESDDHEPEERESDEQEADAQDSDDILTLDLADSIPGRVTPSISEQPMWEMLDEEPPEEDHDPDFASEHLATVGAADEVLEYEWRQPPPRNPVLWPYAALLVLALGLQFCIHEFDSLSKNVRTRPLLQQACDVLGCELPTVIDINAIRSEDLLVRSHPEFSNALSVQMTLRNSGPVPQPFPDLNLQFSNVRNEAVFARSFSPAEYLPGEVPTGSSMAVDTPVQIHFDILDPGIEAVNYAVSFSRGATPQG